MCPASPRPYLRHRVSRHLNSYPHFLPLRATTMYSLTGKKSLARQAQINCRTKCYKEYVRANHHAVAVGMFFVIVPDICHEVGRSTDFPNTAAEL